MQLLINGDEQRIENDATVEQLLAQLELDGRIAVELNGEIVPRTEFATVRLSEGDRVEIVQAIGGG